MNVERVPTTRAYQVPITRLAEQAAGRRITANIVGEDDKDALWISQRQDQQRRLNLPQFKWWEPKKFRYGLGAKAGY